MPQPDARGHIVIPFRHDNLYNIMMHQSLVYDGTEDAYSYSNYIGEAPIYVQKIAIGRGYCIKAVKVQVITLLVDNRRVRFRG